MHSIRKMENQNDISIFFDKKIISAAVINLEADIIKSYSELLRDIKEGLTKIETIDKDEKFQDIWSYIYQAFKFLENNKLRKLSVQKKTNQEIKDKIDKLKKLITKYATEHKNSKLTIKDLNYSVDTITEVISLCGYHDDEVRKDKDSFYTEE